MQENRFSTDGTPRCDVNRLLRASAARAHNAASHEGSAEPTGQHLGVRREHLADGVAGPLPPYRGRSFTGRIASASPDAPEPEVRIHSPPAASHANFYCTSPSRRFQRAIREVERIPDRVPKEIAPRQRPFESGGDFRYPFASLIPIARIIALSSASVSAFGWRTMVLLQ